MKPDNRPNYKRRPKAAPVADARHAPGYFAELVFKHNFPPMWQPQFRSAAVVNQYGETAREVATRTRETALAQGRAYATGTIPMVGTPKGSKPVGWM